MISLIFKIHQCVVYKLPMVDTVIVKIMTTGVGNDQLEGCTDMALRTLLPLILVNEAVPI